MKKPDARNKEYFNVVDTDFKETMGRDKTKKRPEIGMEQTPPHTQSHF